MDPQPGGQTAADFPLTDPTAARLTGPAELVVAVPALIGFRPRDSLVAVGVRSPDSTVVCTLRVDLADVAGSVAARRHIARVLANQGCDELFLVVVGGRRSRQGPPRRRLVCALRDECATIGLPVRAAVWAAEVALGARWACYGECGCDGALPDPACSSVTAPSWNGWSPPATRGRRLGGRRCSSGGSTRRSGSASHRPTRRPVPPWSSDGWARRRPAPLGWPTTTWSRCVWPWPTR
jgi:hypothetical protein